MPRRTSAGRPTGAYTQATRLFRVQQLLEAAPDGARIEDLARELEVTGRSIRRDLDALEASGSPLETVTLDGERRVRLARTGRGTEPVRMTRFQRYSLAAVRKMFDVLAGTPFHDDLSQLFAKLAGVSHAEGTDAAAHNDRFLFIPEAPKNYRRFKDQIYEVFDGVLRSLTLSFQYQAGTTPGPRKLEPYALVFYRNGLYVVGIDVAKRAPRTFAIERMRRVRALPQAAFVRDPTFDVSRLFDGAFGIIAGSERVRVVIEFDKKVASFVEERTWHPTQRVTRSADGLRCEFKVAVTEEVVAWVLRWGASARVVEPADLARRVRDEMTRGAALYLRA